MTSPRSTRRSRQRTTWRQRWGCRLNRVLALLALANLGCVAFNLTYISARDTYLWGQDQTWITRNYDPIKGIEPHRSTQKYLQTVDRLKDHLQQPSPQESAVQAALLSLQLQSRALVDDNPFEKVHKSGTLERIKNQMRLRLPNPQNSAKQAFATFWTVDHLSDTHWRTELQFFDRRIRPLMATNYWRAIGENNFPVDHFWRFDLIFIGIFGVDFVLRTLFLSRRRPDMNWFDAMCWRWYDLLLLLPFWQFLRVLPVTLRLHQAGWINLNRIQVQANRFLAENIVSEVTELALVRAVSSAQVSINNGILKQWLQESYQMVEINDVNELAELSNHILAVILDQVVPKIQPDLERLLEHSISEALGNLPFYRQFQQLPGLSQLPTEVSRQVVLRLSQTASTSFNQIRADKEGQVLLEQVSDQFVTALRMELQDEATLNRIQTLLSDFLEEIKLTVVERLEADDVEDAVAEVSSLRQRQQLPTITVVPRSPTHLPRRS